MTEHMEEANKVMLDALENPEQLEDPTGLIGKLMHANLVDYQNTTGMLIESYQRQIADLEAELGAIRTLISELFHGPYMPTESAIRQAVFYPSKALVEAFRERQKAEH